jgi:enoyl-[acyl-carrier protein] reductase II
MSSAKAASVSTRITSLFQCRYPIVLPGMSWISTPELVAAVSNAGGVGILATGPLNATQTRESIHKIRSLTDNKPFGIGATLLMPGAAENAKVALEEQVPIINVSLGKAEWIADGLSQYGGKMLATVTNQKHAQAALDSGADAFMVTGHEAAAHGGNVTSLVLVPSLCEDFPDVPIVAAGGFATGRGLHAALSLGADAVAMGSRMAVTQESPLAQAMKEAIVQSSEHETVYGKNFDGIPARVLQTPMAEQVMKSRPWLPVVLYRAFAAAQQMNVPLWKVLPGLLTQWDKMFTVAQFGAATESIMAATVNGDIKRGVQFVGQCQGMIHDIPAVDDLVQRIMMEARQVHQEQRIRFDDDSEEPVQSLKMTRAA